MSAGAKERLEQYVSVASLHSAVDVEVSACVSFACASEQWAALLAMAVPASSQHFLSQLLRHWQGDRHSVSSCRCQTADQSDQALH